MRRFTWISIAAMAGALAFAQSASAERVCKEVCDHGSCVKRCVHHRDDAVVIHRHHDRFVRRHDEPGIRFHAPGVGVDIH
jgi:hypothetical protein